MDEALARLGAHDWTGAWRALVEKLHPAR